jgi:hypothetical protein
MDDTKFWRIRQLILDCTTYPDNGILYESNSASEKGYSGEEIAIADEIFTNWSCFTTKFLDKVKYVNGDSAEKSAVYYVEFVKIIFIIEKESQKSTYILEEDLLKMVFLKEFEEIYERICWEMSSPNKPLL